MYIRAQKTHCKKQLLKNETLILYKKINYGFFPFFKITINIEKNNAEMIILDDQALQCLKIYKLNLEEEQFQKCNFDFITRPTLEELKILPRNILFNSAGEMINVINFVSFLYILLDDDTIEKRKDNRSEIIPPIITDDMLDNFYQHPDLDYKTLQREPYNPYFQHSDEWVVQHTKSWNAEHCNLLYKSICEYLRLEYRIDSSKNFIFTYLRFTFIITYSYRSNFGGAFTFGPRVEPLFKKDSKNFVRFSVSSNLLNLIFKPIKEVNKILGLDFYSNPIVKKEAFLEQNIFKDFDHGRNLYDDCAFADDSEREYYKAIGVKLFRDEKKLDDYIKIFRDRVSNEVRERILELGRQHQDIIDYKVLHLGNHSYTRVYVSPNPYKYSAYTAWAYCDYILWDIIEDKIYIKHFEQNGQEDYRVPRLIMDADNIYLEKHFSVYRKNEPYNNEKLLYLHDVTVKA